jgi:Saf4/Yju2 protein
MCRGCRSARQRAGRFFVLSKPTHTIADNLCGAVYSCCRYFPPDFDPADLPKGQRAKDNAMKVRMMLPMTVRCKTCGEFMYKGTKFNCKKEDVAGETYLGLQIFRFYMHCRKCSAEITYITDPQNIDYKVEHGATRNFEVWKQEQTVEEALKAKRAAEDEDKLKRIENKTADAKREMDMFEALDDMLHSKGQHNAISSEAAIATLKARAADEARATGTGDLTEADEDALRLMIDGGQFTRRLEDDDDSGRAAEPVPKRIAPAAKKRTAVKVQPATKRKTMPQGNESSKNISPPSSPAKKLHNVKPDADTSNSQQALAEEKQPSKPAGLGLGAYSSSSDSGT